MCGDAINKMRSTEMKKAGGKIVAMPPIRNKQNCGGTMKMCSDAICEDTIQCTMCSESIKKTQAKKGVQYNIKCAVMPSTGHGAKGGAIHSKERKHSFVNNGGTRDLKRNEPRRDCDLSPNLVGSACNALFSALEPNDMRTCHLCL